MQRLYAEAQKADMEAEISLATMQKNQSEEQEHNMEFETRQQGQDTEFQDQQQTRSENEVKRVVKLDKAGNIVCDREGQEMLDKVIAETMDRMKWRRFQYRSKKERTYASTLGSAPPDQKRWG